MKAAFVLLMLGILGVWIQRLYLAITYKKREFFLGDGTYPTPGADAPLVSILVPARNEERNIGNCLGSLCKLDYPNYEVIVIDDRSTDNTAALAEEFVHKDARVKLIRNQELAEGWIGKSFALFQGQAHARGKWLLFSDADTVHAPGALSQSLQLALDKNMDMVTLLPSLTGESFWEKLLQPIAGAVLMISFPIPKANNPSSQVAFANGQYILIKRETYDRIGKHEALKGFFLEDIAMAKAAKALKAPMMVVPSPTLYQTRMYKNFKEIWHGWSRIYFYIFEKHFYRILLSIVGIFLISLLPVIATISLASAWIVLGYLPQFAFSMFVLALLQLIVMRIAVFRYYALSGCNPYYSILNPLGCLIMMGVLTDSLLKIFSKKGMTWRGTTYAK